MFFPKLTAPPQQRITADRFLGLDRRGGSPMGSFREVENVCTKVAATGIGRGFAAGDGVTVRGCETEGVDGLYPLQAADENWIAVPGMCRTVGSQTAAVTVERTIPDMDFVVEQGNRLWGCKYGIINGEPVNEIYASKLGDFRNWNSFAGLSTDSYAAVSDFGSYVASLSTYLEANPEAVTQYYSFFSDLKTSVEAVDAAFQHYKVDTEGYIRTGIVYYDGAVPVYGVAVGQDLTCREVDGEQIVEQNNFRAVFTATRLSFWQDATEVAYVSNNRLYITNITVLGGIAIGAWSVEAAESGLTFRWIGG